MLSPIVKRSTLRSIDHGWFAVRHASGSEFDFLHLQSLLIRVGWICFVEVVYVVYCTDVD